MAIQSGQFEEHAPSRKSAELQSTELSTSKLRNRRLLVPLPGSPEFFEREEPDIA